MQTMTERFMDYVRVNTRSDERSTTVPSTDSQVQFAKRLVEDLEEIGLSDVAFHEDNGFVIGTLPATIEGAPSIGFIAHMDTADYNADGITPRIVENYDGADICLNEDEGIFTKVSDFPNLKHYIGKSLIVTDGMTLLGGDDKAGIV